MSTRKAYVSGYFYPDSKEEINDLMKKLVKEEGLNNKTFNGKIIGAVVPHAGYIYSAPEALHFFEGLKNYEDEFDTIIILNPNHNGVGKDISLSSYAYWDSPYGKVEIDREFQEGLPFYEDDSAHNREHSGEVIVPLIKYALDYNVKIVPISIKNQSLKNAKLIAENILKRAEELGREILIIASSDFCHYEEAKSGRKRDDLALEAIKNLDADLLQERVEENSLTICGYGPIMAVIEYANFWGDAKVEVLRRGNSGEITGDNKSVVNYNSILFYR